MGKIERFKAEDVIHKRTLVGVCIANEDYLIITLSEPEYLGNNPDKSDEHIPTYFANYVADENDELYGWGGFGYTYLVKNPMTVNTGFNEYIIAEANGTIRYEGVGDNKRWEKDIFGGYLEETPYALAKIGGRYVATGKNRSIFICNSPQKWQQAEPSDESMEHMWKISMDDHDRSSWKSFYALDGFSLDDMYLGGGYGDLWHYNHKAGEWKALAFDSKKPFLIQAICCADDDKVYVGGRDGMLAIGRDEEWEFVSLKHGRHIEKIKSVDGKLYIGTEAHTYIYQGANDCEIYEGDATEIWSNTFGKDRESIKKAVESINNKPKKEGGIFAIANIDGQIITTGEDRRIFIRKGPNEWRETQASVSFCDEQKEASDNVFCALDGFSKDDIYLGGGDGDLWHFNLSTGAWKVLDFKGEGPFIIQTICCADDGKVYVGGRDGMLAIGRDDEWEFVRLDHGSHIEKIVSFNGKIFIGTEAHTYVLNHEHQSDIYDFDGEINFTGGHMIDAAYGTMVVSNSNGKMALYYKGKWQALHGIDN